jgi:hypothetical protein
MSSQPPLTDAHGHLQADRFDADRGEVITRLRDLQEAGMPVHASGGNHDRAVVGKRCPSLHFGLRGAGNAA